MIKRTESDFCIFAECAAAAAATLLSLFLLLQSSRCQQRPSSSWGGGEVLYLSACVWSCLKLSLEAPIKTN